MYNIYATRTHPLLYRRPTVTMLHHDVTNAFEPDLDSFFGGDLVDEPDEHSVDSSLPDENASPNRCACTFLKRKRLPWLSVAVFQGPNCNMQAVAALKQHAGDAWFEEKTRKKRVLQQEGIPLAQTPRSRLDGTAVSEYKCPFAQVTQLKNTFMSPLHDKVLAR